MSLAPIALFVYNRPVHTCQTVEALLKNKLADESDLIIFSDAPKTPKAFQAVNAVREYIRAIKGFGNIRIIEREVNIGLADSIIEGVTKLCEEYGRVIVLEDDLVTSSNFLPYMNDALIRYQDEENVMHISGYMFPIETSSERDSFFLPLTNSWGWGTWRRAWKNFDPIASDYKLLKVDAALKREFNLNDSRAFFEMLELQLAGEIDSWAIRWYLSVFQRKGLSLFPSKTLIANIGLDGSGTHCGVEEKRLTVIQPDFTVNSFPEEIIEHLINRLLIERFFSLDTQPANFLNRVKLGLLRLFKSKIHSKTL